MGAKTVKLRKYTLIDAKMQKQFKKWKLVICKMINIPVLHKYNFLYSIDYYAGKLKKDDVIIDQKGVVFMVASAGKGMATIITHHAYSEQPKMSGVFSLVEIKEDNNNNKVKK